MEIEPLFDFEALGLPSNFLEVHDIDSEFFYSLTDELRTEILLDYLPKDNATNEHLEFLNSLPPNLREEVLLTTTEDILQ